MKGRTVAILESRAQEAMADVVRKRGGVPFVAPALAEIPDLDPVQVRTLIEGWRTSPPDIFIFQTGVGTRALFAATDNLHLTDDLLRSLEQAQVVVRGPKPTAVLRSRKVRIDAAAADPFTTREVVGELANMPLAGKTVAVQRYGESNRELQAALEGRGARAIEIATYRWGLPADTSPLRNLIRALDHGDIDVVAFTSAVQVMNLFAIAAQEGKEEALRRDLGRTLVASIGPACTAALRRHGIEVSLEAKPPKLGPFIAAIEAAVDGR